MKNKPLLFSFFYGWKTVTTAAVTVSLCWSPVTMARINENTLVIREGVQHGTMAANRDEGGGETITADKPEAANATAPEPPELPTIEGEPVQRQTVEQEGDNTLLWIGAGVAGAALLGVALGGGGGGSDAPADTPETPPPAEESYSGPAIAGEWSGELDLVKFEPESITATITQQGENITIRTTSSRPYGRLFTGTIDNNGAMLVYDQETGEDWTTSEGNATEKNIVLTDWISGEGKLDRLELHR